MKHFRKSLAVLLSVLMLVSLFSISATSSVSAAEKETIIIACSDYQTHDGTLYIQQILAAMKKDGIAKADHLFFTGDYAMEHTSQSASSKGLAEVKAAFAATVDEKGMIFAQGNHDPDTTTGLTMEGDHDPAYGDYGLYVMQEDSYQEWGSYNAASVAALQIYLDNKLAVGFSKPIFIVNHIPLHWSNRTIADGSGNNGYKFFNVINDAAGKGLNIIYLFGHNHSHGYEDFIGGSATFLKKGDTIQVSQGKEDKRQYKEEILNFTYMNAGYIGYYTAEATDAETDLTMSVFRIRGNEVIISRYSADGLHNLKSAGVDCDTYSGSDRPAVNPTVYAGSWKIAADGTASQVEGTIREMPDDADVFTAAETSTSEDVSGLAFKFDVTATGLQVVNDTEAVYDAATVNGGYKLVRMGAIVTNNAAIGVDGSAFYLDRVDGKKVIDIHAKYLFELSEDSAAFAVRIKNIPMTKWDTAIYARPYYVFDYNGVEITVYGDVVGASYNGKLSNNDNEFEW